MGFAGRTGRIRRENWKNANPAGTLVQFLYTYAKIVSLVAGTSRSLLSIAVMWQKNFA